jgi:lysozyme family protein
MGQRNADIAQKATMTAANYPASLAFVWRKGFDSPDDGFHVTPGDPGGGTKGGVIRVTWDSAVRVGIVKGSLAAATNDQLSAVLETAFWGPTCDALPDGLDLLLFNGRMMSGRFPRLFQQCLGFTAEDVDGWIGPESLKVARSREPETLIDAISGAHYAYLAGLAEWSEFGAGWTTRLKAVQAAAIALADAAPVA